MHESQVNTNKQTAGRKEIPYAVTNFESLRTENYLYVDKTRFIEMLENESTKYYFLIRPRKFGKSLFLSVLEHYYDIRFKNRFDELFGDLYIEVSCGGLCGENGIFY